MDTVFFHQNGSPRHVTDDVVQILNETLPDRWLGEGFLIAWPPTSPDLIAWLPTSPELIAWPSTSPDLIAWPPTSPDLTFSGSFLWGVNQIEQHDCRRTLKCANGRHFRSLLQTCYEERRHDLNIFHTRAEAIVSLCSDTSRCVEVLNTSMQNLEVCCFSA